MSPRRAPHSLVGSVRVLFVLTAGMSAAYACAAPPRATPPDRTPTYREDVAPGVAPIEVTKTSVDDPALPSEIEPEASGGASSGGSVPSLATGGGAG